MIKTPSDSYVNLDLCTVIFIRPDRIVETQKNEFVACAVSLSGMHYDISEKFNSLQEAKEGLAEIIGNIK